MYDKWNYDNTSHTESFFIRNMHEEALTNDKYDYTQQDYVISDRNPRTFCSLLPRLISLGSSLSDEFPKRKKKLEFSHGKSCRHEGVLSENGYNSRNTPRLADSEKNMSKRTSINHVFLFAELYGTDCQCA